MTNKNNRYASFLLPNIFYKFHAPKHIMILKWVGSNNIFKNLVHQLFDTTLYILQLKIHKVYIRKYV